MTMITIRPAAERGHRRYGWLDTYYTFSFNDYYDPTQMGFRALRVINEDRVAPGQGFGMHGHRDMEILTYVLSGELAHKDSLGNGSVLRAGEFQRMSAGTGIRHSEFNPSPSEEVHLYQIWLLPAQEGQTPSYEQRALPEADRRGRFQIIASPDGRDGSLVIGQDAAVSLTTLGAGETLRHPIAAGRHAWLQVIRGAVRVNGFALATSDGAAISDEPSLSLEASGPSEVMLFDLP
jgi:redox-sensitive bicupin YhaK (pirin superfamily)